jgi:hypothetical protein
MNVDYPRAVKDDIVRLHTLAARLTERIGEARDVRARLIQALAANAWPNVRSAPHRAPDDRRRD